MTSFGRLKNKIIVTRIFHALLFVCEGGKGRRAGFVWINFVLMFYVRVVSGNRTGMSSQVGTVFDGQTFDFFPPRDRWVEPVPTRSREIENSPQLEYTPAPGFEPGSPDWEAGMQSTTPPRTPPNETLLLIK